MLSVDEALRRVMEHVRPAAPTTVDCREALGMVLAEDVAADLDSPPYDKSLVDGYAVVAADVQSGRSELQVVDEIPAGATPSHAVAVGSASRIMTGAPIPTGADAVVMVEHTEALAGPDGVARVRCLEAHAAVGQNIMRRGASMRRGQTVLRAGCRLRAIELGVLAEVGRTQARVVARPAVGVLATGNELVPPAQLPGPGQIRNSNSSMLVAAVQQSGATAVELGIGRDEHDRLSALVAEGLRCDVLLIAGGVSAGKFDLIPDVLRQAGVEQVFHKVRLKPGKPLWFGVMPHAAAQKLVFGLPGNPVSALVCFELFVRPAIRGLMGIRETGPLEATAQLTCEYVQRGDRTTYHPARLTTEDGQRTVEPLRWQGSGDLRTLAEANALACFPPGQRTFCAGETIVIRRLNG
jgi:molybdopterin molybdotransferase